MKPGEEGNVAVNCSPKPPVGLFSKYVVSLTLIVDLHWEEDLVIEQGTLLSIVLLNHLLACSLLNVRCKFKIEFKLKADLHTPILPANS